MNAFFIAGQVNPQTSAADFPQLIKTIQFLNKNALTVSRTIKNYKPDVDAFLKALCEEETSFKSLYTSTLGYSARQAEIDFRMSLEYIEKLPESTTFDPRHSIPVGLIAVYGTWSSPLYRFALNILPALLQENSVLLFCEPEVSEIYAKLAELLKSPLGENRIAVLPILDREVMETLLDHPSINAITGQMHLYESSLFRSRPLDPEKLYSLHFGAHNPVLVMNDADLSLIETPMRESLQYHTRSEVRFNRWFVQEKIYPDFMNVVNDLIGKAKDEDWGRILVPSYKSALQIQNKELAASKHWLLAKSESGLNICSDFSNCSPLHQTELLAPLLTITRFKNGPEATKFAGTTHFANATSIFTSSADKYAELSGLQKTALVYHNTLPHAFDVSLLAGSRHTSLVTAASVFAEKRIILC